jgi:cytoskeletal protein RodZ
MPLAELESSELFDRGVLLYDYKHVASRDKNKRYVVVSSKSFPFKSITSNFSFLYLILVLYVICIIAVYVEIWVAATKNKLHYQNSNFT